MRIKKYWKLIRKGNEDRRQTDRQTDRQTELIERTENQSNKYKIQNKYKIVEA